jgi:phospholipase/carboxylesterase
MDNIPELVGPEFGPLDTSHNAKQLIILLHGLGADGFDLINLAPHFAKVLPNARFVSPNAPENCDMAPPGVHAGFQWFSLQKREEADMLSGARTAEPTLNKFIDDQLLKYGLKEDKLALIGFSQGTMLSLFVATRRKTKIAGIVGFSGQLVGKKELKAEVSSHPPVVLINGDQDELIPIQQQKIAIQHLRSAGIEAEGHIRPNLGHSIDTEGIKIGCDFLQKIFN